jgi:hypothetical protein
VQNVTFLWGKGGILRSVSFIVEILVASNGRMIDELQMIWKEAIVA